MAGEIVAEAPRFYLSNCVMCSAQFEYGHMDFTYSAKEELGYYINSLLMRT